MLQLARPPSLARKAVGASKNSPGGLPLRSIALKPFKKVYFPFNLPILENFSTLSFNAPVTFFVGENGSGKSTLLESIACAAESITVGSQPLKTDPSLIKQRELAQHLQLIWTNRTRKGFFLRAEDFFGYVKQQNQLRQEMEEDLKQIDQEYINRSDYAKGLAKMGTAGQLGDMKRRYGDGLDARSHGESFLALFQDRFVAGGLYLLDEPEAPLSPIRQLGFLALLGQMINQQAQFIIATHSPILMAFPNAQILAFEDGQIKPKKFDELEHVTLTRDFLNNPEIYLRNL